MPNTNGPRESAGGVQRRTTQRAKILSLLAAGSPVTAICAQVKCSSRTITKLLKDKEFCELLAQERELIAVDATSQTAAVVGSAIKTVAKAIAEGDGHLAMTFLKETGVLRTTGGQIGMDQKNVESGQGLKVIVNVSSDQFSNNNNIIEAESVVSDHND